MRTTLGRGSAYALTSLCVSSMVSYNLVRNTKRGFLFVPIAEWKKLKPHHLVTRATGGVLNGGGNKMKEI